MKKNLSRFVVGLLIVGMAGAANATLTTIGTAVYRGGWSSDINKDSNGIDTDTFNLIYDDDSPFGPIVWLDYTSLCGTWQEELDWAGGLNLEGVVSYNIDPGYSVTWSGDWRLPNSVDDGRLDGYEGYDGTSLTGYNITTSEMGHLYYTELGNKASKNTADELQSDVGLSNKGPFINLIESIYWMSTEYAYQPSMAWSFVTTNGGELNVWYKDSPHSGLAVRSAQVQVSPVPEPATMLLFSTGLAGLAGVRRRQKAIRRQSF